MRTLNDLFASIYFINLDDRPDRLAECQTEMVKLGFSATRFPACRGHMVPYCGGMTELRQAGCHYSHMALLKMLVDSGLPNMLILEDDFQGVQESFNEVLNNIWSYVPEDYDMLYLGGHYQCPPERRINKHVIKIAGMLTTSSYAVSSNFAKFLLDNLQTYGGPIDAIYANTQKDPVHRCYCLQPRLMVQRPGFSSINNKYDDNTHCMLDVAHENMV